MFDTIVVATKIQRQGRGEEARKRDARDASVREKIRKV